MHIIHVSAECYPIAKVGGLADVVGALPKYQNQLNVKSQVILPFYQNAFTKENSFKSIYESSLSLGSETYEYKVLELINNTLGFDVFLIDQPDLLHTDYVYSYNDTDRFLAFQITILNWIVASESKPDIIHCHDHHTGLIPFMMSQSYQYKVLKKTPSVLTIHNAQYQGWFSHDQIYKIPEFDFSNVGLLDWGGSINPLAAGIKCAWRVTAVSPNYMEELKSNANGLESLLSHETAKSIGILNGIDTSVWNTETDAFLPKNYSVKTVQSGRKANKKWLCDHFNLDIKKPLFAFIGRLVGEKGADLLPDIIKQSLDQHHISFLILGSGHDAIENQLELLKSDQSRAYNAFIGYDEKLAHIIYAGADFLLMPSRVEPCGLNQLYALRYGSIPIVTEVGGLKDTVTDISANGFGLVADELSIEKMVTAIGRATNFFGDQDSFKKNRELIMKIDHSWNVSANEYIKLYKLLN